MRVGSVSTVKKTLDAAIYSPVYNSSISSYSTHRGKSTHLAITQLSMLTASTGVDSPTLREEESEGNSTTRLDDLLVRERTHDASEARHLVASRLSALATSVSWKVTKGGGEMRRTCPKLFCPAIHASPSTVTSTV